MREAVRRAARLILRAEDELREAGAVIANGYVRLDRARGWMRATAGRRSPIDDLVAILWPEASFAGLP
jgi:hypothetical protein